MSEDIVRREGPTREDYGIELDRYVYVRTGHRLDTSIPPRHLERQLDELSLNRVPMPVWQCLLRTTLRIVNMSTTIQHRMREFGAFFVDVLVALCRILTRTLLLQITIFLYNWMSHPLIRETIMNIYNYFERRAEELWQRVSSFIQSHLISAPYYHHFPIMG